MSEEEVKKEAVPEQEKDQKKKPAKKRSLLAGILRIISIAVLVLLIIVACLLLFLDKIVHNAVTTVGPAVTGTTMSLENFDSSLFSGEVTVIGLAVGNPDGYQAPDALAFDLLHIKIDNKSLLTDTIIIEEIIVDGLQVDYEIQSGLSFKSLFAGNFGDFAHSESNLTRILENVEAFALRMSAEKDPESAPKEEETPSQPGKEVVIKHILVQNTSISFSSAMLNSTLSIPMPDFEITETEETSYADVITHFFEDLYTNVIEAVAIYLRDNSLQLADTISEGISNAAGAIGEAAGELGGHVSDITSDVGDRLSDITSDVGKQVDNLKETLSLDKLF